MSVLRLFIILKEMDLDFSTGCPEYPEARDGNRNVYTDFKLFLSSHLLISIETMKAMKFYFTSELTH